MDNVSVNLKKDHHPDVCGPLSDKDKPCVQYIEKCRN